MDPVTESNLMDVITDVGVDAVLGILAEWCRRKSECNSDKNGVLYRYNSAATQIELARTRCNVG